MKVSLSASFWLCSPEVREALHSCDMIFTTQEEERLNAIRDEFGWDKVIAIQDAMASTNANIRKICADAEVIDFGTLHGIMRDAQGVVIDITNAMDEESYNIFQADIEAMKNKRFRNFTDFWTALPSRADNSEYAYMVMTMAETMIEQRFEVIRDKDGRIEKVKDYESTSNAGRSQSQASV